MSKNIKDNQQEKDNELEKDAPESAQTAQHGENDDKKPDKKSERKEKLSQKESDDKNKQIEELSAKLKDSEDKYLRLFAEYDNFRKRAQKEKDSMYSEGICDAVTKLLEVLDNLERAAAVDPEASDTKSVLDGVVKTLEKAKEVFAALGVEEIPANGEKFNPELHNAVMHEENPDYEENMVSDVFMKGYKRKDKVIRHSVVKVVN